MIKSIEYFRAIAIILIVAGHLLLAGIESSYLFELAIQNIIFGGTTLFVFISGFLFHHVFFKSFNYKRFLKKKIKTIIFPYIFFSIVPVIYYTIKNVDNNMLFDSLSLNYLALALKYLITGSGLQIYWYIPFIMVMFLLSPMYIKFIGLKNITKVVIVLLLLLISSLLHRPVLNYNVLQSLVYFLPVYLMGITASINKEKIYTFLSGKESHILGVIILLAFCQAYFGIVGSYHKLPFLYGGLDLMLLQKIGLCFFFMVWLHRFESTKNKALEMVAATSFTIYFMHAIILWVITGLNFSLNDIWLVYVLLTLTIILTCTISALIIKKLFPKYSRYLIGF